MLQAEERAQQEIPQNLPDDWKNLFIINGVENIWKKSEIKTHGYDEAHVASRHQG